MRLRCESYLDFGEIYLKTAADDCDGFFQIKEKTAQMLSAILCGTVTLDKFTMRR
jgi:hypothetical protein